MFNPSDMTVIIQPLLPPAQGGSVDHLKALAGLMKHEFKSPYHDIVCIQALPIALRLLANTNVPTPFNATVAAHIQALHLLEACLDVIFNGLDGKTIEEENPKYPLLEASFRDIHHRCRDLVTHVVSHPSLLSVQTRSAVLGLVCGVLYVLMRCNKNIQHMLVHTEGWVRTLFPLWLQHTPADLLQGKTYHWLTLVLAKFLDEPRRHFKVHPGMLISDAEDGEEVVAELCMNRLLFGLENIKTDGYAQLSSLFILVYSVGLSDIVMQAWLVSKNSINCLGTLFLSSSLAAFCCDGIICIEDDITWLLRMYSHAILYLDYAFSFDLQQPLLTDLAKTGFISGMLSASNWIQTRLPRINPKDTDADADLARKVLLGLKDLMSFFAPLLQSDAQEGDMELCKAVLKDIRNPQLQDVVYGRVRPDNPLLHPFLHLKKFAEGVALDSWATSA